MPCGEDWLSHPLGIVQGFFAQNGVNSDWEKKVIEYFKEKLKENNAPKWSFISPVISIFLKSWQIFLNFSFNAYVNANQARVSPSTSYTPSRHKRSYEDDEDMDLQPSKQKDQHAGQTKALLADASSLLDPMECADTAEEQRVHSPPASLVPRIHVVLAQKLQHINPLLPACLNKEESKTFVSGFMSELSPVRAELLGFLTHALLGDSLAAEYLILHLISTVPLTLLIQAVEEDFVEMRKNDPQSITADDLHQLLIVARFLSLSAGQTTLSRERWLRAKQLESLRRTRLQQQKCVNGNEL
ncbi:hypothetical protein GH733_001205 [Mirounga leonina]|nr:hypothetical protein GH733_001205 [Mirounga leonina]